MGDLRAETSDKTKRRHFITGASSGIGAAVAAALNARGDELGCWRAAMSGHTNYGRDSRTQRSWSPTLQTHLRLKSPCSAPFCRACSTACCTSPV